MSQLRLRRLLPFLLGLSFLPQLSAQVHYHDSGAPWTQKANAGPDAEVPGWYYNLGITGLRVELVEEHPNWLLVRHVFEDSPANKKVKVGDYITGAGDQEFLTPHVNGYGMDKFGPHGPIADFAAALEACQARAGSGKLTLRLVRKEKAKRVSLSLGKGYGTYADSFPLECAKSEKILEDLYDYLLEHQMSDGFWGSPVHDTFAPLALMASGKRKHMAAAKRNVQRHAKTTQAEDKAGLVNWRYMTAAIVMSEYYLITREKWVLKELQEVYDFLLTTQYMDLSQLSPEVKDSHPDSLPKDAMDSHGGWGHNPGFEGYGPIGMITAQGAIAFALMKECGIEVDRERHDAAYAFLQRASGRTGYVWYKDEAASQEGWADMGRTGTTATAYRLSPWKGDYKKRAMTHATLIGEHPESLPDTHASPIMGMGYTAAGTAGNPEAFRSLMQANKWWFILAQCNDGSFYYQPNRDNTGYGADSRISASAVTAFILSIPKHNLRLTGRAAE
ncbi:MAG: hypothetical protein ACI87O_002381 [Planctomycetota bacterium]|jgi:hypothetical protein